MAHSIEHICEVAYFQFDHGTLEGVWTERSANQMPNDLKSKQATSGCYMYRHKLLGLLVVLLVGCNGNTGTGGGKPVVPPPPSKQTLYQGDWKWVIINVNNSDDGATGLASFSAEDKNAISDSSQFGKTFALGLFDLYGVSQKPLGVASMGPIATPLDALFVSANKEMIIGGVDSDTQFETFEGQKAFIGLGKVWFPPQGIEVEVAVGLFQVSTNPTYKVQQMTVLDQVLLNKAKTLSVVSQNASVDAAGFFKSNLKSQTNEMGLLQRNIKAVFAH